jgi:hypothetical protein
MTTFLKNKVPDVLKARKLSISDLHSIMAQNQGTRISYPAVHRVATEPIIPDTVSVGTLRKVATALGLPLSGIVEIAYESEFADTSLG